MLSSGHEVAKALLTHSSYDYLYKRAHNSTQQQLVMAWEETHDASLLLRIYRQLGGARTGESHKTLRIK